MSSFNRHGPPSSAGQSEELLTLRPFLQKWVAGCRGFRRHLFHRMTDRCQLMPRTMSSLLQVVSTVGVGGLYLGLMSQVVRSMGMPHLRASGLPIRFAGLGIGAAGPSRWMVEFLAPDVEASRTRSRGHVDVLPQHLATGDECFLAWTAPDSAELSCGREREWSLLRCRPALLSMLELITPMWYGEPLRSC